jgi:hypothetical protein
MVDFDGKTVQMMMPIGDLFNYFPTKINTDWSFNEDTKNFEIKASKDIEKGEEVRNIFNFF